MSGSEHWRPGEQLETVKPVACAVADAFSLKITRPYHFNGESASIKFEFGSSEDSELKTSTCPKTQLREERRLRRPLYSGQRNSFPPETQFYKSVFLSLL